LPPVILCSQFFKWWSPIRWLGSLWWY